MSKLDFDVHEHEALHDAKAGDMRKLAACVRFGYPLSKQARAVVADFLENPQKPKGNPNRWMLAVEIAGDIEADQQLGMSETEAVEAAAKKYDRSPATIPKLKAEGNKIREQLRKQGLL